jgi:protein SCO1/2
MPLRWILPLLATLLGVATSGAASSPARSVGALSDPQTTRQVGIEEQLGAVLPLDLEFRDETGQPVVLRDLITGPTIIAPVYYACPNVCAFLQGALARALPAVKRTPGEAYRVLSVSFDDTETPADARRSQAIYAQAMNHRFPAEAWRFLTGDQKSILALTRAAGYHFLREGADFNHPVALFVVSGDGKIVRYLYGTRILPMDLTLALVEAAEGRVSPAIRKMAQFCFSYDPAGRGYVFNIFRVSATVILLTAGGLFTFLVLTGRKSRNSEAKS